MTFADFCRSHGLIVEHIEPGRWIRVPTTDHPRKRNGAYKFLGDIGWVQNHAIEIDVSTWRADGDNAAGNTREIVEKAREFERRQRDGWKRAAKRAAQLVADSTHAEHGYLHLKGFGPQKALVSGDDLIVPMRHWKTNDLVGAQVIRWNSDDMKWEKKMLPGMRAKGAVFRIGPWPVRRTWLVEGFATGLSVEAALKVLRLRDAVLVCFSAGNLIHVASVIDCEGAVFADNDASGAGERAAQATGLRYCMAGQVGFDANDLHKREGIFKVASLMLDAINSDAPEPVS